jgi:hypothetical protein
MGTCSKHPDRQTAYQCMKHEIFMCEECLHCRDPEIYCKFRSSCAIHFLDKEKRREARRSPANHEEKVA